MRNAWIMVAALLTALLLIAAAASAQTTIRCESNDGKYHECRTSSLGQITLTRQLSDTACVEGRTWGTRNGMVWVSGGCRADFALGLDSASPGATVICESLNNTRQVCRADVRGGVMLARRLSDNECLRGRSWGTTRNGIWVDHGCRAEFNLGSGRSNMNRANARTLVCESSNGDRHRCSADTSYGVQLTRQISSSSCNMGKDWGYDQNGVWVDNGCRAEFTVGGYRGATRGPMTSAARPTVTCESQDGKRSYCRANTTMGVSLLRQTSDASCVQGRTWGYDRDGIWVTNGCRAEFVLDSNY